MKFSPISAVRPLTSHYIYIPIPRLSPSNVPGLKTSGWNLSPFITEYIFKHIALLISYLNHLVGFVYNNFGLKCIQSTIPKLSYWLYGKCSALETDPDQVRIFIYGFKYRRHQYLWSFFYDQTE